ncbi:MAG: hypothetical protein JKY56_01945 [Kofleriaceae bacterium]|nr:hypothetical protein [Kofleriaceae bacterium]
MKSIFVGLALTASFAFAGCGSDVVKEFEAVVDKMCACDTMECATKAGKAMDKIKEGDKPSESDMKKIGELTIKMSGCMEKLAKKEMEAATK